MATPVRELGYGTVEVYSEETLGIGSYGKVCKAKCGQLPCAAKLLHDTMFGTNDPGIRKFVELFEQECRFLRMIKHPNIVQFLGTVRDPRTQRLALLMERMDESLTRFLEHSTGPLHHHTQLNICHDVALALAYLHSNDIIHRDLSSNNVLLIGEGRRAKVTDFGMSKLIGMNPCMTPAQTQCPGTPAYMPPEALVNPPRYSNKLDCFSHGVLAIQIITRKFPNPTDATTTVEDTRFPTGIIHVPVPEIERRKKDIDLVDPSHPLLPLALHCLKDRDSERPSADELCKRLVTLKGEQMYTRSVAQSRESVSVQTLQEELVRARANQQKVQQELERVRANHEAELNESYVTFHQHIQEKDVELERVRSNYEQELNESHATLQQQIEDKDGELERARANHKTEINELKSVIEQLRKENQRLSQKEEQPKDGVSPAPQVKVTWRRGRAPEHMSAYLGAAVVHGNTAYFSHGNRVYSYTPANNIWTQLNLCAYENFGLAVVNNKVTTIGGSRSGVATNILLCLEDQWRRLLPPMAIVRVRPATITTPTHLIVAGGKKVKHVAELLSTIEILDTNTLQWSFTSSLPKASEYQHMSLCDEHLYLSEDNTIFSCSVQELLVDKSCSTNSSDGSSVWTKLANIPVQQGASLTTLGGQVLAVGGSDQPGIYGTPTRAIHIYNKTTNSWSVIGEMPTPRYDPLVAVLPSNELLVVGGGSGTGGICNIAEIASIIY